ncbi:MAG: pilus assembly protein [Magnetovibrio sp.]|nr:pilus assembly protein [Magnetovibrio sp.]
MTNQLNTDSKSSKRNWFRDFFRDKRRGTQGVVALEFALIAPVFLYLLMGILEVSILLFVNSVVDGAAQSAARKIRTGEAQQSGDTETAFRTELCASITSIYDCNDIELDVSTHSTFSSVSIPDVKVNGNGDLVYVDGDSDDSNDVLYVASVTAGGASEISVVHVIYSWDFATPMIGELVGDGSSISLFTTVVFRNEPYE